MPAPSLDETVLRHAYAIVQKHGAVSTAANAEGYAESTLRKQYQRALRTFGLEDVTPIRGQTHRPTIIPPKPHEDPTFEKPRIRVRSDGGEIRVLAIGDVHAGPGMPTEHLGWIAQHAIETKPDHSVQIGDFGDWASCSAHEGNETVKGRLKPSFTQDEEAVHDAYEALYGPMDRAGLTAKRWQTDGNHEHRVDRFVNAHPELVGDWDRRQRQLPARFRVERKEYGEWLFLGGVGFVHHPANQIGRAYGGKTAEMNIANDAVFSIIFGHSHKQNIVHRPKIGPHGNGVTILNLGTAMPKNHIPPYAQWSTTGWSYGIFDLTLSGGRITGHSFTSIDELGRRYG